MYHPLESKRASFAPRHDDLGYEDFRLLIHHYWQKYRLPILISETIPADYYPALASTDDRPYNQQAREIKYIQQALRNNHHAREIKYIQQALRKENISRLIGYFHNPGAYLIAKDYVIASPLCSDYSDHIVAETEQYSTNLRYLLDANYQHSPMPNHHPQLDDDSGATLCFAYIEELLIQQERQLKQLSLKFAFYTKLGEIAYFFLPPPQVLAYSQSRQYNNLIHDLVYSSGIITAKFRLIWQKNPQPREYSHCYQSIAVALERSKSQAEIRGNHPILDSNKRLLAKLPAFRQRWLKAYREIFPLERPMQEDPLLSQGAKYGGLLRNMRPDGTDRRPPSFPSLIHGLKKEQNYSAAVHFLAGSQERTGRPSMLRSLAQQHPLQLHSIFRPILRASFGPPPLSLSPTKKRKRDEENTSAQKGL